jgi:hypothetical protein
LKVKLFFKFYFMFGKIIGLKNVWLLLTELTKKKPSAKEKLSFAIVEIKVSYQSIILTTRNDITKRFIPKISNIKQTEGIFMT